MLIRFHFPGVDLPVHHWMDGIPSPGDAFTLSTLLYRVDRVVWEWPGGPPQVYLLGPIAPRRSRALSLLRIVPAIVVILAVAAMLALLLLSCPLPR